jgi:outer membrane protein OmpA-like peptidoglycan-associated protein
MKGTMSMSRIWMALLGSSIVGLLACGAALPPKELVDARTEYQKAAGGEANRADPAQVHVAKEALDEAERSFSDDPSSSSLRKAELAEANAGLLIAQSDREKSQRDLQQLQVQLGLKTQAELEKARQQLSQEQNRTALTQQELEHERQARLEAEKRYKEALDNLARMASVKQETRGMVITLSGAVLFASNQSDLLPAAMAALDNVVTALKSAPDRNIVVEGHTDSQGQRAYNMDLSLRRAQSVRDYIVSHGIPSEIIRATGLGPDRPIADNATPEGRANNRRVEIIVSPPERK